MNIEEAGKQAQKVVALAEQLDDTFTPEDKGHSRSHLVLAIMCGLKDAFIAGMKEQQEKSDE